MQVAWSCVANGTKRQRYREVSLVRVPEGDLNEWREANRERCEADALMPRFAPGMRYGCVTKTHFTHAQKLTQDGGRTLFNEGKVSIKVNEDSQEGYKILEEGVVCCVYNEKLWKDKPALYTLMRTDNEDADVELNEDEIQALGRVESAVSACEAVKTGTEALTIDVVLKRMKENGGLGAFTEEHTKVLIGFRLPLLPAISSSFRNIVFQQVCGRVRVVMADYHAIAPLDPRAMWAKVAILVHQYLRTLAEKFPPGATISSVSYSSRSSVAARCLPRKAMKQLELEGVFLKGVEGDITKLFRTYPVRKPGVEKVMRARSALLDRFGKQILKVASDLDAAFTKAEALAKKLTAAERQSIIDTSMQGKRSLIEQFYVATILESEEASFSEKPQPIFPVEKTEKGQEKGVGKAASASSSGDTSSVAELAAANPGQLSEAFILNRLKIKTLAATPIVRLLNLNFLRNEVEEIKVELSENDKATKPEANPGPSLYEALLHELKPDNTFSSGWMAKIRYGVEMYDVDSDILTAVSRPDDSPKENQNHLVLTPFDWDKIGPFTTLRVAENSLVQVLFLCYDSIKGVQIEQISKVKDLPCKELPVKLKVKAKKDFKVKELVLPPALHLRRDNLLTFFDDVQGQMFQKPDKAQMDLNLLSRARVTVIAKEASTARSSKGEEKGTGKGKCKKPRERRNQSKFYANSPLFHAKQGVEKGEHVTESLSPFWAVEKTFQQREVNAAIEPVVFELPNMAALGGVKMPTQVKKALWCVEMDCVTNTKKLKIGDYIRISVMEPNEFEEEEAEEEEE